MPVMTLNCRHSMEFHFYWRLISAVIGGFHLIDADQERINKTAEELKALSPGKIYTGHCTGLKAEAKLMHEFGSRFKKMRTGMTITFKEERASL